MEQKKELTRDERQLLLHIPHSSTSFPATTGHSFKDLDDDERLLIDYYTDELFAPRVQTSGIASAVFPYCRLYCDVERLVNDPLEQKGLGISYHRTTVGDCLPNEERSFSTLSEAFNYYADFHAYVAKKIVDMTVTSKLLLIDCHSFSSLPTLLCCTPPDVDICIGFNEDGTCPNNGVIDGIVLYFKAKGYKVGVNTPFSNSKTFSVPVEYHSMMIEVNKRLYMNELTLEKSDNFCRLKSDIQSLYDVLLKG